MHDCLKVLVLAAVVVGAMPVRGAPAPADAPSAASGARALHRVDGFRSARWGMDEESVRAAIARDFAPAADALRAVQGTAGARALALRLGHLAPGPGGAELTYVFDARTQRLTHINVVWSTGPTPDAQERGRMARAAAVLTNYFHRQAWAPGATTQRLAPDASFAIVFAGVDPQAEAVEVRLSGAVFERPGLPPSSPSGPATLRMAYFSSIAQESAVVEHDTEISKQAARP